jgi:hypothetical protein
MARQIEQHYAIAFVQQVTQQLAVEPTMVVIAMQHKHGAATGVPADAEVLAENPKARAVEGASAVVQGSTAVRGELKGIDAVELQIGVQRRHCKRVCREVTRRQTLSQLINVRCGEHALRPSWARMIGGYGTPDQDLRA